MWMSMEFLPNWRPQMWHMRVDGAGMVAYCAWAAPQTQFRASQTPTRTSTSQQTNPLKIAFKTASLAGFSHLEATTTRAHWRKHKSSCRTIDPIEQSIPWLRT
jgi:hypothetical protein